MPIIEIVSNQQVVKGSVIAKIKQLGSRIGYDDPRHIWVATQQSVLMQVDVAYVKVMVKQFDYNHPNFRQFCHELAALLREGLGKSVEVVLPGGGPMLPMAWAPTDEGAVIYKD